MECGLTWPIMWRWGGGSESGEVYAWGYSEGLIGILGTGDLTNVLRPKRIDPATFGGEAVARVWPGVQHTLVLTGTALAVVRVVGAWSADHRDGPRVGVRA